MTFRFIPVLTYFSIFQENIKSGIIAAKLASKETKYRPALIVKDMNQGTPNTQVNKINKSRSFRGLTTNVESKSDTYYTSRVHVRDLSTNFEFKSEI